MKKIEWYFDRLFKIFGDKRTTKALFQATVVLASVYLIGAKEQGEFLYEKEASAYELMYQLEERVGASMQDIQCSELENGIADCRLAKYKMKTVSSYISAFAAIMELIWILLLLCGLGSLTSFVIRPVSEDESGAAS